MKYRRDIEKDIIFWQEEQKQIPKCTFSQNAPKRYKLLTFTIHYFPCIYVVPLLLGPLLHLHHHFANEQFNSMALFF